MTASSSSEHCSEVTGLVRGIHVQGVGGDRGDWDTSRLLDLEGLAVERVEADAFRVRVVHVVPCEETAWACPTFGVLSTSVK